MTFVVRVEHEYRRRLWSALTMATTFGKRSCAYDVLGMEESLRSARLGADAMSDVECVNVASVVL